MRRVACVILFVLGGWMLSSEIMLASVDIGAGSAGQLAAIGLMAALAAPFLLLGTWVSPGNRFAELGLTLMITAGVGAAVALVLVMVTNDPSFKQLMPPDQPMPAFRPAPVFGLANLLLIAGSGYLVRRRALGHTRGEAPDLERIFGDE